MNHAQRPLTALRHQELDRVPIDFAGVVDTTMQAIAYKELRQHLGLAQGRFRVIDAYQQVVAVREEMCGAEARRSCGFLKLYVHSSAAGSFAA